MSLDFAAFDDLAADLAEELGRVLNRRSWDRERAYSDAFAVGPGIGWEPARVKYPVRHLAPLPAPVRASRPRAARALPRCRGCGYLRRRCNCKAAAA